MKFGDVSCANSDCEEVLGYFPADVVPKNIELYCVLCKSELEKQDCEACSREDDGDSFQFTCTCG